MIYCKGMNVPDFLEKNCPGLVVRCDERLDTHTTFKVGGKADYFIEPADSESLACAVQFLSAAQIDVFVLGGGSNLVVADEGLRGAVVSTSCLRSIGLAAPDVIRCGAGCTFAEISAFCEHNGLSGLEEFCGLPGTAGGAIYMNARCYEKSVSDVLVSCGYLDLPTLETSVYRFAEQDWAYKKSPFQSGGRLILEAVFRVGAGRGKEIGEKNARYFNDRKNRRQFEFPSAGSVFKNNRAFGAPSGKIIEAAGLRGLQIGGAQVAPWHGNFIINTGGATAADIKNLTELVIRRVREKTGFTLEPEILFTGPRI